MGQVLDVAPLVVPQELDVLAVHQPHAPAGLCGLLDHSVLADRLTATGAADDQQVGVPGGAPHRLCAAGSDAQGDLEPAVAGVVCDRLSPGGWGHDQGGQRLGAVEHEAVLVGVGDEPEGCIGQLGHQPAPGLVLLPAQGNVQAVDAGDLRGGEVVALRGRLPLVGHGGRGVEDLARGLREPLLHLLTFGELHAGFFRLGGEDEPARLVLLRAHHIGHPFHAGQGSGDLLELHLVDHRQEPGIEHDALGRARARQAAPPVARGHQSPAGLAFHVLRQRLTHGGRDRLSHRRGARVPLEPQAPGGHHHGRSRQQPQHRQEENQRSGAPDGQKGRARGHRQADTQARRGDHPRAARIVIVLAVAHYLTHGYFFSGT